MAPRQRDRKNRDLPNNLYATKTGYVYKHSGTGKRHGMGSDRARAIVAANILNSKLAQHGTDLVGRVMGVDTVAKIIDRYRAEYISEKQQADSTKREREYRLNRIIKDHGQRAWETFDLKIIADWLKPMTREAYIKHRGELVELFKFACSVGLCERNIAELTLAKASNDKVRKRWTLQQFETLREQAEPWLQVAMDLAILTLQRREDLVNMRFEDVRDGRLFVCQHKTKKRLAIKVGAQLEGVLKAARTSGIASPYIIHRKPDRRQREVLATKTHWASITGGYLTKAIAKLRDQSGLFNDWNDAEKPTLHEFRSLGAHLYREAGFAEEYVQALLGHSDMRMTEHYLDGHKEEWDEVSADLNLKR